MDFLSGLFGANDQEDEQRWLERARDFVSRVESGDKAEGYSSEEAFQNYARITEQLNGEEFEQVSADAFREMSPAQRREFANVLREQGGLDATNATEDPDLLANITSQLREGSWGNASGVPAGMLGGDVGDANDLTGALGGLLTGGNLATAEMAEVNRAAITGLLENPVVKMVLGLISANAMKRMLDDADQEQSRQASDEDDRGGGIMDAILGRDDEPDDARGDDVDVSRIDRDEESRKRRL